MPAEQNSNDLPSLEEQYWAQVEATSHVLRIGSVAAHEALPGMYTEIRRIAAAIGEFDRRRPGTLADVAIRVYGVDPAWGSDVAADPGESQLAPRPED